MAIPEKSWKKPPGEAVLLPQKLAAKVRATTRVILEKRAMGTAKRKIKIFLPKDALSRKAKIAPKAIKEIRDLRPLQGLPMVKLAFDR